MEVSAWRYFLFCAMISVVFSRLGFNALDRTDLSKEVSPLLLSLLKHSLAVFNCHASIYAFVFRPKLKVSSDHRYIALYAVIVYTVFYFPGASIPFWYFLIFISLNCFTFLTTIFDPNLLSHPSNTIDHRIHLAVGTSVILVGDRDMFFPCTVSCIAFFIVIVWLSAMSENERFDRFMSFCKKGKEKLVVWKEKKKGKLVEIGIGMMGTVLFQNFFKLTSFDHVVAFLYLSVVWLADLCLLHASDDLGILNFLLSNVIVGCTVSNSGLGGTTLIVCCVALVLHGLRLKLQSVSLVKRGREMEGMNSVGREIEVLVF